MTAGRLLSAGALLAAAAALAIVALGGGEDRHRVTAVFDSATTIFPGLDVRAAGQPVGEITAVEPLRSGRARLELTIEDEKVWPLPRGTTARLRWAGLAASGSRYVELIPGPADAPTMREDSVIEGSATVAPIEVDRLFRTFDARTRRDLRAMIDRGGAAFGDAGGEFRRMVERTPSALARTRGLLDDMGADTAALETLVRSTDRVANAAASADPGIGPLLASSATTLDAVASEARNMERALHQAPATLAVSRQTLARTDHTLIAARELARELAPGIRAARRLARPAASVLGGLIDVGPPAFETLQTLRRSSPDIAALLRQAGPLMPRFESIGRQGAEQLACVRPYAPEAAGLIGTWQGAMANGDKKDKHFRVHPQSLPFAPGEQATSKEIVDQNPGLGYAFPRPPGLNVGDPWLIPECGVGPDALDPAMDPESMPSEGSQP